MVLLWNHLKNMWLFLTDMFKIFHYWHVSLDRFRTLEADLKRDRFPCAEWYRSDLRKKAGLLKSSAGEEKEEERLVYLPENELDDRTGECSFYFIRGGVARMSDRHSPAHHWTLGIKFHDGRPWVIIEGLRHENDMLVSSYRRIDDPWTSFSSIIPITDNPFEQTHGLKFWQFLAALFVTSKGQQKRLPSIGMFSPKELHALAASIPDKPYVLVGWDCQTWFNIATILVSKQLSRKGLREPDGTFYTAFNACLVEGRNDPVLSFLEFIFYVLVICGLNLLLILSISILSLIRLGFNLLIKLEELSSPEPEVHERRLMTQGSKLWFELQLAELLVKFIDATGPMLDDNTRFIIFNRVAESLTTTDFHDVELEKKLLRA